LCFGDHTGQRGDQRPVAQVNLGLRTCCPLEYNELVTEQQDLRVFPSWR
jgi:hypothetical protein